MANACMSAAIASGNAAAVPAVADVAARSLWEMVVEPCRWRVSCDAQHLHGAIIDNHGGCEGGREEEGGGGGDEGAEEGVKCSVCGAGAQYRDACTPTKAYCLFHYLSAMNTFPQSKLPMQQAAAGHGLRDVWSSHGVIRCMGEAQAAHARRREAFGSGRDGLVCGDPYEGTQVTQLPHGKIQMAMKVRDTPDKASTRHLLSATVYVRWRGPKCGK